jgi:transcriptional regulator PpsR
VIEPPSSAAALARFASPLESLGVVDTQTTSSLIVTASDVALVVDAQGVILDAAFGNAELAKDAYRDWIGRRWVDTVTIESRPKIEELIRDTSTHAPSRWRQINYPVGDGPDVPVRYSAIRYGSERKIIAVGRDLRAMAVLQQRLAEAQQAMEREYARIRDAEKRYRLLFQFAAEAVLIVDAGTHRVVEANPAAAMLIGKDAKKLIGQAFGELFDDASQQAARSFVAAVRVAPRIDNVHVNLTAAKEPLLLSGSLFRQDNVAHVLVLLSRLGGAGAGVIDEKADLARIVDRMPDAFVVVDPGRRVLTANSAFLDLVQASAEDHVRGQPIERWLGRPGVDVDVLFANLRSHGSVRHFSTIMRGEFGANEDVEVAGVDVPGGTRPCAGFSIRSAAWRAGREKLGGRELPRTVEQFTDLVGRVPLKNLVRETTDLIERLCIEAALQLTRDNRASAAEMLGLSRQGLYAKLRRYGLGDSDESEVAN